MQRVRILEHIRGNKWKAEWIEPNPGLTDYVESGQLIVPWKEVKAFLREETSAHRLREHNEQCGHREDDPVDTAITEVFESVGDDLRFYRGHLTGAPEAVERAKVRAGMDPAKNSAVAYVDRQGILHLPFDEALELAKGFCAAEPAPVLAEVEATESKWSREVGQGADYLVELLNGYRAAWALIRQWAGHDPAIAQREARIERLERLVWDAVYALQRAALDDEANRLRRAIERGR
jgi:hypothetical protein